MACPFHSHCFHSCIATPIDLNDTKILQHQDVVMLRADHLVLEYTVGRRPSDSDHADRQYLRDPRKRTDSSSCVRLWPYSGGGKTPTCQLVAVANDPRTKPDPQPGLERQAKGFFPMSGLTADQTGPSVDKIAGSQHKRIMGGNSGCC